MMQGHRGSLQFSATDIVRFLECRHLTALDYAHVGNVRDRTSDDAFSALLAERGTAHELAVLNGLRAGGRSAISLPGVRARDESVSATLDAMRAGVEVIHQAALYSDPWVGYADFFERVDAPSKLGAYSYEVSDAKLAHHPKPGHLLQLCHYAALLTEVQGRAPDHVHLWLGNGTRAAFRLTDCVRYFDAVRRRYLTFIENMPATEPMRCDHCSLCHWRETCSEHWRAVDHLNQVAGISVVQIRKLESAGVSTLDALSRLGAANRVARMEQGTLVRLREQARLQREKRELGDHRHRLVDVEPGVVRGLARLPAPSPGDVFLDLEGNPLEPGGLEYLFGLHHPGAGKAAFTFLWAHSRAAERVAFEGAIDFIIDRLQRFPDMHVYHYAHYEPSALKRLMCAHGTREAEVDDLLRRQVFVDLYKVVREGVMASTEGYSLKDIEALFMPPRSGDVTSAGTSVVVYETWRQTQAPELLEQIRAYNQDDLVSTRMLRDWLVSLRPAGLPWYTPPPAADDGANFAAATEHEKRLEAYRVRLMDPSAPPDEFGLRELTFHLLDFHRREAKPRWWQRFARQEMELEELVGDPDCLAGMIVCKDTPPRPEKRSMLYEFEYPEQEFKISVGDNVIRCDTLESGGNVVAIDDVARRITLKLGPKKTPLPAHVSVMCDDIFNADVLRDAVFRVADSILNEDGKYKAVVELLKGSGPRIRGVPVGRAVASSNATVLAQAVEAVSGLDESHLFIQGPPGAGKTFTGAHLIVEMMARGRRVGVSANSHKAINNLLSAVENEARRRNFTFRGAKKSSRNDEETLINGQCTADIFTNQEIDDDPGLQLVAGTAWLFARAEMTNRLDVLFVDEAGQVALANLVAMGTAARNVVLLGDQMQLGQPIQGTHPGKSGCSALDFLLDGAATVPPERGIFLPKTYRLHSAVCRFLSDAVYDGRLEPQPGNDARSLELATGAHPVLRPAGISFVPVEHEGNSQHSVEEATVVVEIYRSLLAQKVRGVGTRARLLGVNDILVVSPYNLQVRLLQKMLPEGARVGTVDKFQGQEAPAVIVSMATSSGDDLSRHMEFLYSRNRLNVALSRAQCLAVLVASPRLMSVKCRTVEQLQLVNMLCWAAEYADAN